MVHIDLYCEAILTIHYFITAVILTCMVWCKFICTSLLELYGFN